MESVLESVIVPCRNAEHGCKEKFSYGKELVHEKECCVYMCYCPAPDCNYKGMHKNLYCHYYAKHEANCSRFTCGQYDAAWLRISKKILVLQEYEDGPLVVVHCFKAAHGVYVTVNCIY
ncbi:PREDICTED: E3 ubiquitin-protein ligase SINA-like 2 [Camelina sativa]|uniref:E3 ubiquitin-protein ligase SINA-like 2 n=1 Tax=Camelina sativa TaxID=90675 RepID=A0ABM0Y7F5_CAMSA|nr:PREDICTED: E3 ubiquitin-protein ligase SINA-like 2 [Camelina sativa]